MVRFDHERHICIVELHGRPTMPEIHEVVLAILEHPERKGRMDEVWDFRDASLGGLTAADLQHLAAFVNQHLDRIARRTAFIVGRQVNYGICRMWAAYAEDLVPQERRLFWKAEEAFEWLAR